MRRTVFSLLILISISAAAQVQTIGDISFAVPDGWHYQQSRDYGGMAFKAGDNFWVIAVYTPMPSSGNPSADFKAAWTRVVMSGPGYRMPGFDPYKLTDVLGYPGVYYDGDDAGHTNYVRLYVLEAAKSFIPVAFVSVNRGVLDSMEHMARAVVGSVRLAPLKATPIRNSITMADLAGNWSDGIVTSTNYYNDAGQYRSNSLTAVRSDYAIAANGSYTYKFGGLLNNRMASEDDTGVIELSGEFVTFKGRRRTRQYRFLNVQQALDGSTVVTLLPAIEMSKINVTRDSTYLSRAPQPKGQ